MFMLSKEAMNSVISLRDKISDPKKKAECIADLENMIKMKEAHLARAEWSSCCGNMRSLAPQIDSEIRLLQSILETLQSKNGTTARSLLDDYIALLQKNYMPEPEQW
jgi:hypothetical protein